MLSHTVILLFACFSGLCRGDHKKLTLYWGDESKIECHTGHIDIHSVKLTHDHGDCEDNIIESRFKKYIQRKCQYEHVCVPSFSTDSLPRKIPGTTYNCSLSSVLVADYECVDDKGDKEHEHKNTEQRFAIIIVVCVFIIGLMIGILIGCRHKLCPGRHERSTPDQAKPVDVIPVSYIQSGSRDNLNNIRYIPGPPTWGNQGTHSEVTSSSVSDTSSSQILTPVIDYNRLNSVEDQPFFAQNYTGMSSRKYFDYDNSRNEIQVGGGRPVVQPYAISSMPLDGTQIRHVQKSADEVQRLPDIVESPALPEGPPFSDHTYEIISESARRALAQNERRLVSSVNNWKSVDKKRLSDFDLEVSIPVPEDCGISP